MKKLLVKAINLGLFGAGDVVNGTGQYINANTPANSTNYTTGAGLSSEMKTYYSDYLIDLVEPKLVHAQFGQKQPIPRGSGKTVEFRKYDSLPKLTTALQEGVTPTGQKMNVSVITATVSQYGGFIELSDMLLLTAIDNNMVQATKMIASQAGRTLDTIVREVLNSGTNVQIADSSVSARYLLVGGSSTAASNKYMSVDCIKRAVRALKNQNAEKIGGEYVAIIHPDCSYDLTNDPDWKYPHQYQDTQELYSGEIGKVAGVRFVESTEAKVWHSQNLSAANRTLTVSSYASKVVTVDETLTASDIAVLPGRKVIIGNELFEITSATASTITLKTAPISDTPTDGDIIYPGEAGAEGRDIYSTIILGDNAYGVTEISGGGLEHIVKQLGSSGVADALNQRASVGWKATLTALILVQQYMIRLETACTFESGAN